MDPQQLAQACVDEMWRTDHASQYMGMSIDLVTPGTAVVRMKIRPEMVNGMGIVHGGYIFSLADSAFAFACNTHGERTVAHAGSITFIRPANSGETLIATATEKSRGTRTGVYDVEVRRDDGKLIAMFRGNSFGSGEPHELADQQEGS